MKCIWQSTKWKLDHFDSCIWLLACIPTTFVGRANTTSIPTTFVGTAIPTKLVVTVYFDKSCVLRARVGGVLGVSYWCQISDILDWVYSLKILKYILLLSILKSIVSGVLQELSRRFQVFFQRGLKKGGGSFKVFPMLFLNFFKRSVYMSKISTKKVWNNCKT